MTRWMSLLVLTLCGCGPAVCDYPAEWADRCKVGWSEADEQACQDKLDGCTKQEKLALEAFWLCMDKNGAMECGEADTGLTGADSVNAEALLACQPELQGVPISCSAAIGVGAGVFAGLASGSTEGTATP